jgi:hypothetical protein
VTRFIAVLLEAVARIERDLAAAFMPLASPATPGAPKPGRFER